MKDINKYKNNYISLGGKVIMTYTKYCNHLYQAKKPDIDFEFWCKAEKNYLEKEWDAYVKRVSIAYNQTKQRQKPYSTRILEYIINKINEVF